MVDDEPVLLRALRRLVAPYHDVVTASGPKEALRALETERDFDIVLCDVQMPDMTGPQLLATVAEKRPDLKQRFVFMTAGAFSSTTLAGRPHLQKPFLLEEVMQAIDAVAQSGATPTSVSA